MSVYITHWPEGARICKNCGDIIEACHPFYFDDEVGSSICTDCGEKEGINE